MNFSPGHGQGHPETMDRLCKFPVSWLG